MNPPDRVADEQGRVADEPGRQRLRKAPLVIGVTTLAVVAVGAGLWGLGNRPADGADPRAAAGRGTTACPTPQTIVADPSVAPVIESAGSRYGATFTDDCHPIRVEAKASRQVAHEGLGAAAGWVPEDMAWQAKAKGGGGSLAHAPHHMLGWSPIVVVAPDELAEALDGRPLTGDTLVDLTTAEKTFADYGQPSWGRFKLVLPTPADSVTGAAGFGSLARQVGGGQEFPLTAATATEEQLLMPSVQWRTVAQPSPAEVTGQLGATPADAPSALGVGPRAGITTEVVALNQDKESQGREGGGLRAWHLDGGRSGVRIGLIAPAENPTMDGFAQWLAHDEGRQALLDSGLRVADRTPAVERLTDVGLPTEGISETTGLPSMNWGLLTQVYAAFSHRSSTLVVLDVSGSMGEALPGSNVSKADLIGEAAGSSWSLWPPGSVTGLMEVNSDEQEKPQINVRIPLQPNDTPEYLAQLPEYMGQFERIQTQGGTPLYEGIWRGYREVSDNYREDHTNTVVVLTDGRNEDSTSTMTADDVIRQIKESDPEKKINIGLVALGNEADYASLQRIAEETGNRAWLVQDPREVATVLPQIEIAFAS